MKRFLLAASPLLVLALLLVVGQGCGGRDGAIAGASADIQKLMKDRNLNEENVVAALKTYTPTGVHDEYYIFASGGHSGQVIVIGVPSMRILKYIAVFTPEPWQGYGYGDQTTALPPGDRRPRPTADTHHPPETEHTILVPVINVRPTPAAVSAWRTQPSRSSSASCCAATTAPPSSPRTPST